MTNSLMPGAGGAVSPAELKANPITVKPKARPQSDMMKHYGSKTESVAARFSKLKEAKAQIKAVKSNFGDLVNLQDTIKPDDVVKASGNIVGAGIPAVQMATILSEMPEQPTQLQGWVMGKYKEAIAGEQQILQGLASVRHELITASFESLIAHSAETEMMSRPVAGRA